MANSNSPLSGARGIFSRAGSRGGKIPDYELEEIIELVFGYILVCYIYLYIYILSQAISALNNDNVSKMAPKKKNVKQTTRIYRCD